MRPHAPVRARLDQLEEARLRHVAFAHFPGARGAYALIRERRWQLSDTVDWIRGNHDFKSQRMPSVRLRLHTSVANISPRVGFAFDASGNGTTILRGGYGIFYARAINSTIYQALIGTGAAGSQTNPNINPGTPTCAPTFPQVLPSSLYGTCLGAGSGNTTAYFFDPNFKLPQIQQADLTVEQQLSKNDVFSLSWLGSWGRRLPDFVDTNLPAPTAVSFTVNDPNHQGPLSNGYTFTANAFLNKRPNPNFSSITDIFSGVSSNYEALVAQFKHRFSHYISLDANYNWSHAMDFGENNTTGASATALLDPTNIRLDYGNSNQNVPNRFVIYSVIDSPWHVNGWRGYLANNFELAPDYQVQTGLPYSVGINGASPTLTVTPGAPVQPLISTLSFNGSGGANRVPVFIRDAFQQPRTNVVDLRASKRVIIRERYNLEFLAEAFNLANHQNVTAVNSYAYTVFDNTAKSGNTTTGHGNELRRIRRRSRKSHPPITATSPTTFASFNWDCASSSKPRLYPQQARQLRLPRFLLVTS